jgi:general secretion pathway protein D
MQGFALVEQNGLALVVPEAEAKLQAGSVSAGAVRGGGPVDADLPPDENANNLVPVLRPLISPNNTINVNPGNNSLVITDYADNLQRIGRIIAALDVSNATDVEVMPLRTPWPPTWRRWWPGCWSPAAPPRRWRRRPRRPGRGRRARGRRRQRGGRHCPSRAATPDPARRQPGAAGAGALADRAARPAAGAGRPGEGGNIHVVYLKNADATKLAATLRAAMAARPGQRQRRRRRGRQRRRRRRVIAPGQQQPDGPRRQRRQRPGQRPQHRRGQQQPAVHRRQIQADPATNSLIISARAGVPPAARRDRPARPAPRPGLSKA